MTEVTAIDRLSGLIKNKEDLYHALQYNQFITPPRKDSIMTQKFMVGILSERYWMMKSENVTAMKACAFPPTKNKLTDIVCTSLLTHSNEDRALVIRIKRTVAHIRSKQPDVKWQLLVLAQLEPNHFVFSKEHTKAVAKPKPA